MVGLAARAGAFRWWRSVSGARAGRAHIPACDDFPFPFSRGGAMPVNGWLAAGALFLAADTAVIAQRTQKGSKANRLLSVPGMTTTTDDDDDDNDGRRR